MTRSGMILTKMNEFFNLINLLNLIKQFIFTHLFHENEVILLIELNCAYLVSNELFNNLNNLNNLIN